MAAPASLTLIIIVIIAVILYIVTMSLFLSTAYKLTGSDRSSLLAAGAMIGIAIPLIIVGAIFGMLHFGQLYAGKKNPMYMWLFIILSALAGIMVFVACIIGWALGGRLEGTQKTNVQAAAALSMIGGALFIVAFILMLLLAKKQIPKDTRDKIAAAKRSGGSYEYTSEDKKAIRGGLMRSVKSSKV
jgi:hypothetical protein